MVHRVIPDVRVHADFETLSTESARVVAERIATGVSESGRFAISLAGGRTPVALYEQLASRHRAQVPWERVHFYWSDERYVPADDPASNYGVARAALLDRLPVPPENIHPMSTLSPDPAKAAADYESMLRERFESAGPLFDLSLLGLGVEGHTASLFPGSPALLETRRWVVPVVAPASPARRLTLTLPALNLAREIYFVVSGAEKALAVARALDAAVTTDTCPAAGVRPGAGRTVWWVDTAAAAFLRPATGPADPPADRR
jgi:6-phosphogluconolactonase